MLLLIDSNILLRLVEPKHAQHVIASSAIESLDSIGHTKVIVPQIVYEFWAVATRPLEANGIGMTTAEVHSALESVVSTFRLLRDERTVYEHWRELVVNHDVKGKHVHDARLVAAMRRHAISHLVT